MKLSFQPDDPTSTTREFEEVQSHYELFGQPVKKPADPSIKSLLAFEEFLPSQSDKPKWMTEAKDSYRGYFYNKTEGKYYRLKPEAALLFLQNQLEKTDDPQQIHEEKVKEIAQELPDTQAVSKTATKMAPKSGLKLSLPVSNLQTKDRRPLSASKSTTSIKQDTDRLKRQETRIKKLHQTTRWLPNSAFTTYYGKPAFANYGIGNTNPSTGGFLYGDYLKSHNIAPHEGKNNPLYSQVYKEAETKALSKRARSPEPPRKCKDEDRLNQQQVDDLKKRSQILAEKKDKPSKRIMKPNLLEVKTFKSEHGTPENSIDMKLVLGKNQKTMNEPKLELPVLPKMNEFADYPQGPAFELATPAPQKPKIASITPAEQTDIREISHESIPRAGTESQPPTPANEPNHLCENSKFTTAYKEMTQTLGFSPRYTSVLPLIHCKNCNQPLLNDINLKPDELCPPNSLADMPFNELNPKNYKELPARFTQRIPAAGKLSYKSLSAYKIICPD